MDGFDFKENGLHDFFLRTALAWPDGQAVASNSHHSTYREILLRALRIARMIVEAGLTCAPTRIAILGAKGPAAYAAQVAVMLTGNTFVPLSIRQPVARSAAVCAEAQCAAVIACDGAEAYADQMLGEMGAGDAALQALPVQMATATAPALPSCIDETAIAAIARPNAPHAYIMFTSGSTGKPKGVPITHRSAAEFVHTLRSHLRLGRGEVFSQIADLSFDFSIAEIYLAWATGGSLAVPTEQQAIIPSTFIRDYGITVWSSVPTVAANLMALGALEPNTYPSIKCSMFCGEILTADVASAWTRAAPQSVTLNLYGPTEATVFATSHTVGLADVGQDKVSVPIGRPLPGFEARVVGIDGEDALDGQLGELWLSGPQVFEGYWQDPSLTADRLHGPDSNGRVWYRTGDITHRDSEGELHFHGRVDHQIKVRGYRVEIQEVEAAIRRFSGHATVAVVPDIGDGGRCNQLIAYCCGDLPDTDLLRERLARSLPGHMLPARFVYLESMPLNVNGKVDYRYLMHHAASETARLCGRIHAAPL